MSTDTPETQKKTEAYYYPVDGKTAKEWLERNTCNRRLRPRHVERLMRDMLADNWEDNGETIKFYENGDLGDGQHRLWAVYEASRIKPDIAIEFLVVANLKRRALRTVDAGVGRSYADFKRMENDGEAPAGISKVTALANRVVNWNREVEGRPVPIRLSNNPYRIVLTNSEVDDWYGVHKDLAELAISQGRAISGKHKLNPSTVVFFCYLINEIDKDTAKDFTDKILDWTNIGIPGHPILTLIQSLQRRKNLSSLGADEMLVLFTLCWNTLADQERYKTKYNFPRNWQTNEKFPLPKRPKWLREV